ncbi:hypothetical protein CDL15_Pgr022722 [Punica granatum]|uniref:Exocyst complex component Sec8 n=1 Tax=Punica granatum TaxID=22663 RepID=A0A218XSL8_PUNGR|nr:hypothetical protein CDL15_Pgr022722 [Punica granatum]
MADPKRIGVLNTGEAGEKTESADGEKKYLDKVLDDLVSLNGLFTVAVFMGLSFAEPGIVHSLEDRPECDPDIEIRKRMVQFEIASFGCFLFSGFMAKTVKIFFYIYQKNDWEKPEKNGRILMLFYLSIYGTMCGCVCLLVAMVDVIQVKLGKLACKSTNAFITVIILCILIIAGGGSILVVGPPGVGKTTLIREIARMLADDHKKRVVIADTSNQIGGDGDVPHAGIGRARRTQVSNVHMQHNIMIEAVENDMPETIIIDEIGTELEALAASTIAQRGVQLVGTAHGVTIDNIIKNPSLQILLGGIESGTLGDEEARKRKVQKTILERKGPPTFTCAVEMISKTECRVHHRLDASAGCYFCRLAWEVTERQLERTFSPFGKVLDCLEQTLAPVWRRRSEMSIFDGLPVSREKAYIREELARIDESWAAARFDSLPHVVHILTSKDREGEIQILREQSDVIEEVVDGVVQSYHSGFNKAIQNYSQILRLFSESAEAIGVLKVDLAEAKKHLGARNKQLHQLWYRSVTLRHIIALLDQIENIAKVPGRIEKLTAEKQYYASVQLYVQSTWMLEREGLQTVGALQDVRSELTKLRGVLFYKVLDDLHTHLYNNGEYSSSASIHDKDEEIPTTTAIALSSSSHPVSRRTRLLKNESQLGGQGYVDGSFRSASIDGGSSYDGHEDDGALELHDEASLDGHHASIRVNGVDGVKIVSRQIPTWLSQANPDEFLEAIKKSDAPLHVKYLQTMVECLCMLGKVAAAGAIICQRLRSTIHDIIMSKIKAHAAQVNSSSPSIGQAGQSAATGLHLMKGPLESYQLSKQKRQNGTLPAGTLLAVSPVSPVMAPAGKAQSAAKELLDSILDTIVRIFENHVIVGELLESKAAHHSDINTPKSVPADANWNPDSEGSQVTGGYSIGFSLTVLQSECQQLICEILRATPEAASADAAVQTARLASKAPSKDKRQVCCILPHVVSFKMIWFKLDAWISLPGPWSLDGSEDGLTFAFRFTDATLSVPNQGSDLIRQGWNRRSSNVLQEGYGSAAVLPEQGIYLTASVYRPVLQFTDKVASMLPQKYSQLGNDGLLSFVENFVKDHFLPTMFVDYRKGVQQAISSPAAFRPRAHAAATYTPLIEKGRPVLQGLLAIDFLAREVIGWAQAMPKFAGELVKYVQTFLERTYERCRTSYMEAVLEKQSYMLIGRHDIEKLMRLDPSSACLPDSLDRSSMNNNTGDAETAEIELELSDILLSLRPIKQEMNSREYVDDQDAEEPDDFIISLTAQITRRDEEMAPFVAAAKRNYIFGGICSIAANASIKALADMKSINLFGVQQICRNTIALEQALLAFLTEHEHFFTSAEYSNLLKVQVPGREIPFDAQDRVSDILSA